MQGEKYVGYSPERIEWDVTSCHIYFTWNPDQEPLRSLYKVDTQTRQTSRVSDLEQLQKAEPGVYTRQRHRMVYAKNGDLFLYEVKTGAITPITQTLQQESIPTFSGDEKWVIYTAENNLYAWEIATGSTRQLTQFKAGNERKDKKSASHEAWLEADQLRHFEVLNERKTAEELNKNRREALQPQRPKPIYLGDQSVYNLRLSPDMNFVTYTLRKQASSANTNVPDYVTRSGYTGLISARSKVGSPQDTYQMGIYDRLRDTTYLIATAQIPGIYDKPEFLKDYATTSFEPQYKEPREVVIHGPFYSEKGLAVVDIRSLDNKDRWLMQLDAATGKLSLLDRQHDEAWIGGPGIYSWNFIAGKMGWLADGETLWYQSEATGYSHLYTFHVPSGSKKALTSGNFEIREVQLSNDRKYFYIQSNRESPHVNHFYKMPVTGGAMVQITQGTGAFEVTLSPDEKWLAILSSTSHQPWELYLMENKAGAPMLKITESTTPAFKSYPWTKPEIVRFTATDGAQVPARIYKPAHPNGAAVIFVHGAGYLQNVHEWWSSYYREYMFHHLLMDKGYTVLDIDFRASDGYGRDWRTGIYRWMGGKDLSDQVDGASYLVTSHGIDPARIGIYGGSYGGFITLMAMFTAPGTFRSGAALRSVTDWAHYNHGYTANILNTPVEDSLAYAKSSPIYHASGLEGRLLMLHGMVDDNVHFQDVVRLSQRLIELGKKDWDLAVFPMEAHGFMEASSWTDEYRRILELFETTLAKPD